MPVGGDRRHQEAGEPMPDKMLAAKDAAEMLGVCTDTLYRQWRAWDLKAYRIGSGLKFKSSDIDTWIERRAA